MNDTMCVPFAPGDRVVVDPGRSVGILDGGNYTGTYEGAYVLPTTGQVLGVITLDMCEAVGNSGTYTQMTLVDMSSLYVPAPGDDAIARLRALLAN